MMLLPLLVPLITVCVSLTQTRNHKLGVKLCQVRCMERSSCECVAYETRTLTCKLLSGVTEQHMEKGYIRFPKGKHIPFAGACSLQTCPTNTRCLENHRGRAICVHDYDDLGPAFKASTHSPDKPVKGLNKRCWRNDKCASNNLQCVRQKCQCAIGYSSNHADNTCVKRCKKYGNRSMVYKGWAIKRPYPKKAKVEKTNSLTDCSKKCYQVATCISFQYWYMVNLCETFAFGWLDVPPSQHYKKESYFGIRDCT